MNNETSDPPNDTNPAEPEPLVIETPVFDIIEKSDNPSGQETRANQPDDSE